MTKRVLDVGNCNADHGAIGVLLRSFGVQLVRAHTQEDALQALRAGRFDLVLINRILDRDQGCGVELIRAIKADAQLATTPVMLLSNYPEYQETAVAAGAEAGFGKGELRTPETRQKLERFLG